MLSNNGVRLSWAWHQETGRMLHIDQAHRGKASGCTCADCEGALLARKGDERRHHFAHASSGQTGGRETCLHWNSVMALYQRLQDAIQHGDAVHFRWECTTCGVEHIRDFAEGMTRVKREERAPDSLKRPDISLYREDDLCCLIEVVVTHPPEQPVRDYSRERGVNLVVVDMKKGPELDGNIEVEVLEGSVCPNMPPDAPHATLAEVQEPVRVDTDLMAARYEKEFFDIPGFQNTGQPVRLREGQYAVGVLERIQPPPTGGHDVRVYLRHLKDSRFLLPVAIPDKCEDLRSEADLLGKVVRLNCFVIGEGVDFLTGKSFPKRRYRIIPLQVDPEKLGRAQSDSKAPTPRR